MYISPSTKYTVIVTYQEKLKKLNSKFGGHVKHDYTECYTRKKHMQFSYLVEHMCLLRHNFVRRSENIYGIECEGQKSREIHESVVQPNTQMKTSV